MIGDRRALGGPDAGVSVVIGAVLLIGALVSALVLVRLTVVPQMAERAEAEHVDRAGQAMVGLNERVLTHLDRTGGAPLPTSVPLRAEAPALLPAPLGGGAVTFEPGSTSVNLSSPELRVQAVNDTTQIGGPGAQGQWKAIGGSHTVSDVTAVHGLRLNITEPGAEVEAGDRIRLTVTDANGDSAGEFSVFFEVAPASVLRLVAETRDPSGNLVFHNHILEMRTEHWDANYSVNVLDPLYAFDQMIEDAEKPLTLTFSEEGANAAFVVAYEEDTGGGFSVLQGAGRDEAGYERSLQTGPVRFDAENNWFLDQSHVVEHGAVILEQSDGEVFRVDPPFVAEATDSFVRIGHDVPMLDGEPGSVSGTKSAQLFTRTTSSTSMGAIAGRLNVTVTTDYPDLWAEFLEDELSDAGLTSTNCPPGSPSSSCQFDVTTTSTTARLELHGPTATDPDPQDPTHDIALDQLRGRVDMEIQR